MKNFRKSQGLSFPFDAQGKRSAGLRKRVHAYGIALLLTVLVPFMANSQCTNTVAYGTATAPTSPSTPTVIGCNYASEYGTWNSLVAGTTYEVTSTVATDYLTVREGTPGGTLIANGTQPLTFVATVSGTYYIHVNTDAACGTQNTCRDITMSMPPAPLDMGASALAVPTATACFGANETVSVTITNYGTGTIDFSVNPVTVNASVTGPNAQTFAPVIINSGTLASNATQNVVVSAAYNMTAAGTYTFNASTSMTGDGIAANDGMPAVTRTVTAPVTIPYLQNFNASTALPAGWSGAMYVLTNHGTTASNGLTYNLYFANTVTAVAPKAGPITVNSFLKFDYRIVNWSGYPSTATTLGAGNIINIQISTDCGQTFTTFQTIDNTNHVTSLSFVNKSYSLAAYAGQDIIVRYQMTWASGDYYVDIDNFEIVNIPPVDMAATALAAPLAGNCYTANEAVSVTVTNMGSQPLDFSVDPMTVNASVTGPNPITFAPVVINTGTLAVGATQNVVVSTTYNMSVSGAYVFSASTSVAADGQTSNDAMAAVTITSSPGTAASNLATVCNGSPVTLTLTGHSGTIQWQSSTDGGTTWVNETGTGSTTATYSATPTAATMYHAVVCGVMTSNAVTVNVTTLAAPTTVGDTRCGAGVVNLSASGSNILRWYTAPTAGSLVNTGTTYSPTVSATTTYYVENSTASPSTHTATFAAGNGSNGNMFAITALNTVTITGFDGHTTGGTSTWAIYYRPDNYSTVPGANTSATGWISLGTAANVPSAGTGLPTPIPIPFSVTIPAGSTYSFHVVTTAGTGVQYTNGTALNNVYNANTDFQFREGHGGTLFSCTNVPRVFNGRIHYSSGCSSPRTSVTATVNPAPAITATSSTGTTLCTGNSSTLDVTSGNAGYAYTWSPATGLSATSGSTVTATPSVTTTYTVTANDAVSGCETTQTLPLTVNQSAVVTAITTPTVVCSGSPVQLDVTSTTPAVTVTIGTGTGTNTSTGYPAPYGNYYYGARHQMLITAAELNAAGLAAGPITSLAFDVTALNSSAAHQGFTVRMGSTTLASLTAFQTGLTQVYTTASYAAVTGWNTHTFTTPFTWNGTDNIIVETCFNNTGFTSNVSVRRTTTAFTSVVYYRADNATVCSNNTATTSSARPNMRLSGAPQLTYSWSPAATLSGTTIANPIATPAATTTYTAAVTHATTGCVTNAPVTVNVNPLPTVTATSAAAAICEGDNTTLTAAGADTYTWSPATGLSATSGASVTANPTVTTTYTVSGTDVNGCVNTAPVTLTVNPLPVVTLASMSALCEDASAMTITGESPTGGTFSGTGVTGNSFDPAVAGVGTHTITYSYTDANMCSNTATANVTVNALPTVTLSAFTSECSNGSAITLGGESPAGGTFSGTGVSGGMFDPAVAGTGTHTITYDYTDANGCSSSATSSITVNAPPTVTLAAISAVCVNAASITLGGESPAGGTFSGMGVSGGMFDPAVAGVGTHDVYYTFTDANMCSNSDTASVVVYAAPVVTLASQSAVCANTAAFTITGESPAGGTFSGMGVSGGMFDPAVAGAGTHDIIYTFTDANMCSNSDTATVMVNALPVITLASYTPVCEGSAMISLTGESPAGGTYSGTGVSGSSFDPIVAGPGTHYAVYSFTDANSCTGMDSAAIVVNANPVVNLGSDITQCGGSVTLNAGNTGSMYAWSNNDSLQMITVAATGTYAVMVTDTNSCSASDTVMVTINAPAFVDLGADTTICNTSTVTLDAGTGYTYLWSTNATTQTITVSTSGSYTVTVTNADGCQDTDAITVTVNNCDGIAENGNGYVVSVMPNPSEGIFNLVVKGAEIAKLNVDILDIQGKLVYGFAENNISSDFTKEINLGNLAKGVYYLRLNTGTTIVTEKLVIQ